MADGFLERDQVGKQARFRRQVSDAIVSSGSRPWNQPTIAVGQPTRMSLASACSAAVKPGPSNEVRLRTTQSSTVTWTNNLRSRTTAAVLSHGRSIPLTIDLWRTSVDIQAGQAYSRAGESAATDTHQQMPCPARPAFRSDGWRHAACRPCPPTLAGWFPGGLAKYSALGSMVLVAERYRLSEFLQNACHILPAEYEQSSGGGTRGVAGPDYPIPAGLVPRPRRPAVGKTFGSS